MTATPTRRPPRRRARPGSVPPRRHRRPERLLSPGWRVGTDGPSGGPGGCGDPRDPRRARSRARRADGPWIVVRVAHSPWTDDPAWAVRGASGAILDVARIPLAREGTWGAEFFGIEPDPDALVLTKHRYSAFHTLVELYLRARGATTIVLAAVVTNVCVHATARDALHAGFRPVVLEDATAAHSSEAHERAMEDVRSFMGASRRSRTSNSRGGRGGCPSRRAGSVFGSAPRWSVRAG